MDARPLMPAAALPRTEEAPAFQLPDDHRAWLSFAIAAGGGLLLAFYPALPDGASLALLLSMAGLVLLSEWISNLMGRGGRTAPTARLDLRGPLAGLICVGLLLSFLARLPAGERQAWVAVLTGLAAALGLLFLLRLEWVPLDRRLLVLAQLLLTAPCLLMGFRAWGVGAAPAFAAWAPLAVFLPAVTLVERAWMDGPAAPRNALTAALLPSLLAMAALAGRGQPALALFFAAWCLRAGKLVLGRRAGDPVAMPSFRSIHAFGRETRWWIKIFVAVWLAEGLWGRMG